MYKLFSAEVCPFAQRTRALLAHLGQAFELREVDLRDKPDDFLAVSTTGKVPLLIDDDLKLYESQVINDYLADVHAWSDAYPTEAGQRARVRLAMKMWDEVLLPAFYEGLKRPSSFDDARREQVCKELDELERTLETSGAGVPSLLSFHVASFVARMDWLAEYTPFPGLFDDRPALRAWLDDAVAHPAVQQTLPDREATVASYEQHYVGKG